jgi:hypothetical protein
MCGRAASTLPGDALELSRKIMAQREPSSEPERAKDWLPPPYFLPSNLLFKRRSGIGGNWSHVNHEVSTLRTGKIFLTLIVLNGLSNPAAATPNPAPYVKNHVVSFLFPPVICSRILQNPLSSPKTSSDNTSRARRSPGGFLAQWWGYFLSARHSITSMPRASSIFSATKPRDSDTAK